MDKLYAVLQEQKTENGVAFAVTESNRSIEVSVYRNLIIGLKVRGITVAEAWLELAANQLRGVNLHSTTVDPWVVQPEAIEASFSAVGARFMGTREAMIARLNDAVRVMAGLGKLGEKPARRALDLMTNEIRALVPEFIRTAYSVSNRWRAFRGEFHLEAAPPAEVTPAGDCDTLVWAVSSVDALEPGPIAESLLQMGFAGFTTDPMAATRAQRDSSFFGKSETVKLSKSVYGSKAKARESVRVYVGQECVSAPLSVTWTPDNKPELVLTRADMDKMQVRDGQDVNIVFFA
jgi:hypothetical protein